MVPLKSFILPFVLTAVAAAPVCVQASPAPLALAAQTDAEDGDAWLGVYLQEVSEEIARALDLEDDHGALVADVIDDSPAEEAGLRDGDVIVEADGDEISDPDELIRLVRRHEPDDLLRLGIVRDGNRRDIEVTLGTRRSRPEMPRSAEPPRGRGRDGESGTRRFREFRLSGGAYLGVQVVEMNEDLAGYFKTRRGALVVRVSEDSPAEKAGIKAGDVITGIGGRDVNGADELVDAIRGADDGERVEVHFVRRGEARTVEVALERRPGGPGPETPSMRPFQFFREREMAPRQDELREQMDELRRQLEDLRREMRDLRERGK